MIRNTFSKESGVVLGGAQQLGSAIRYARKRRRMTLQDLCNRTGMSYQTARRLEKGDPVVGLGMVISALWVLGLWPKVLESVSPDVDMTGMQEDLNRLPKRVRASRKLSHDFNF